MTNIKSNTQKHTSLTIISFKKLTPLILTFTALASPHAVSNELVIDNGFDLQQLVEGGVANTSNTWALKTGTLSGLFNPGSAQYLSESEYGNVAYVNARGKIAQDLGVPLQPGKTYSVSMNVGWSNNTNFISYQARFLVGNSVIPIAMTGRPIKGQFIQATGQLLTDASHQIPVESGENIILEIYNPNVEDSVIHLDNVSVIVADTITDADNDGMHDNWETAHGFDPFNPNDADSDFDGDGFTNLEEFHARTHPLNSAEFPDQYAFVNNGNTKIEGAMRLVPQSNAPVACDGNNAGAMYFDNTQQQTLICDGNIWNEFRGMQGERGERGERGETGLTGLQGATGDTGEQGPQGIQGIKGDKGERGDKGDRGEQGPAGTSAWADGSNRVTTSVNVGIGNTQPSAALDVTGNVIANDPTASNHLATKSYVDTQVASSSGSAAPKACVPYQKTTSPRSPAAQNISGSGYITGLSYNTQLTDANEMLFEFSVISLDGKARGIDPLITSWVDKAGIKVFTGFAPMHSRFNTGFSFRTEWLLHGAQWPETKAVIYYCLEE